MDPIPDADMVSKFEGKSVAESIVRSALGTVVSHTPHTLTHTHTHACTHTHTQTAHTYILHMCARMHTCCSIYAVLLCVYFSVSSFLLCANLCLCHVTTNHPRQWVCLLFIIITIFSTGCCRFYHTNHVKKFLLKRPFHRGQKSKDNEYKVKACCLLGAILWLDVC